IQGFFNSGGRAAREGGATPPTPPPQNVPAAVDDIAKRFRKTSVSGVKPAEEDPRATRASGYVKDPAAAARAVAQRVSQRELDERDRGPPLSARYSNPGLDLDRDRDLTPPAPAPAAAPAPTPAPQYE